MLTKEMFKQIIEKAVRINNGWKPNWNDGSQIKHYPYFYFEDDGDIYCGQTIVISSYFIFFESYDNTRKFINSFNKNILKDFFSLTQVDYLRFMEE